ncbi:MAG: hypothetical protein EON54_10585 [Alcaligenaceae bacterium]|uniref:Uncharacterized protein n=1 Tax=Variovorax guangxiensis TaxID=1775474 RepID=A0A502DIV6_9BURK|nr:hypothetical protein [Variovorax guangxiensis]RYH60967.1 MAG: hypothetical protein EON54_10585 [Alcaligenaceae bacterium]TPG21404.1 hypothetical protein EAH83_17665 [Variovorax ginsengisoli]TPG25455.1 hypothetical protein EAH82_18150 [Variovorax guangxiensis]
MRPLQQFIADLRFETEEALASRQPRGLITANIAVCCVPVAAANGETFVVYTVNGKRTTLGEAARQMKAAADAATNG